jgi:hypothetical protein
MSRLGGFYVIDIENHAVPDVYRELLEPSLINRVLILDCLFNISLHIHVSNPETQGHFEVLGRRE